MHHVAIMKKSLGFTSKIIAGTKTIESRWYRHKSTPWDRIVKGGTVYFKNTDEMVTAKAVVSQVLQFAQLTPAKVKELLTSYGTDIGIDSKDIPQFFKAFKDKKYCILIFLKNHTPIKPFAIDKTGFGSMSAWITVSDISEIAYHIPSHDTLL